ncbi:MAG TPA: N-carbamoylputrescine amidase [Lachnospiraceae bacterium]|nr:N-carbamoylputrescine amidase [Lachnospiraceae bacterium]
MRKVKVAATQMSCTWNKEENLAKAEAMVREAAKQGANVVLLQELFEMPYFCQQEKYEYYNLATSVEENPAIKHFQPIAKELDMVIPISFYEEAGNTTFNTVAMIDADGSLLGTYRKTHIPCGESYEEKFYFSPGDTGFKVWKTKYGKIGVGICWDQWFPESARCMALLGAEMLLYPTAIGSEPVMEVDSMEHWRRCMQGHAAANIMPVIASNRIGTEEDVTSMTFYGSSFIADETGALVASADRQSETVLVAEFDLDVIRDLRIGWGVFRDRRPEMYGPMLKLDAR